ncbi:PspC domain-containing protein [Massilia sp. Dwa41.01b]|uniref:PspC domain-containing protein n=1 Tax=unclassified Massilia TaxID=2609279 RepID=UPI001600A9C7|nr:MULTISPECIES: PspC domain-containing protein [unclassified Massilia]QNA89809.1 PspC domain-containing protein [Massilia sp. Dwa41.01b]QNB00705.1 PspC domain-containing protein [Massilia sp. Se16.2.3]
MISDEIRRLHELHQAGALSDAEFEQAKAKVLAGAAPNERVNLGKGTAYSGSGSGFESASRNVETQLRALRRSRRDRWLGGVCGGLHGVMGIEAWVWRLVFCVFALITSGFGLLVYLLMWIFVPEE